MQKRELRKTIIRQRDYIPSNDFGEFNDLPSMTVPNEALTIKEIMQKHVSGMRILDELRKQPIYDSGASLDSEDIEKMQHMDLFDLEQERQRIDLFLQSKKGTAPSADSLVNQPTGQGDPKKIDGKQKVKAAVVNDEGSSEESPVNSAS